MRLREDSSLNLVSHANGQVNIRNDKYKDHYALLVHGEIHKVVYSHKDAILYRQQGQAGNVRAYSC